MLSIDCRLEFAWEQIGQVSVDDAGKLVFPRTKAIPGLYLFEIASGPGTEVYVGETDKLSRRLQHYRTPGPSQRTNLRLNALLLERIELAQVVFVLIATECNDIEVRGQALRCDMARKHDRVLLEHAAIFDLRSRGHELLNA